MNDKDDLLLEAYEALDMMIALYNQTLDKTDMHHTFFDAETIRMMNTIPPRALEAMMHIRDEINKGGNSNGITKSAG